MSFSLVKNIVLKVGASTKSILASYCISDIALVLITNFKKILNCLSCTSYGVKEFFAVNINQ